VRASQPTTCSHEELGWTAVAALVGSAVVATVAFRTLPMAEERRSVQAALDGLQRVGAVALVSTLLVVVVLNQH
jgi:hypothetical protein